MLICSMTLKRSLAVGKPLPTSIRTAVRPIGRRTSSAIAAGALALQARDLEILRGLFESRVMTQQHIAGLYFLGKREAAKKRLQKLKAHGLLSERPRRVYAPAILYLTQTGFKALQAAQMLSDYPRISWDRLAKRVQVSELTLAHELAVMDVKVAVCQALRASAYELGEFTTWPLLSQFKVRARHAAMGGRGTIGKPDGWLRVTDAVSASAVSPHRLGQMFYWEIDRSTEAQSVLAEKALHYREHYVQGGLALRFGYGAGLAKDFVKDFAFRVLFVFQTPERRNNFAQTLLLMKPPILTQMWLTTMAELQADPLGAIWLRPLDYRLATAGTAFDVQRPRQAVYRRLIEREAWVEARVVKRCLLQGDVNQMTD
jgi:Replication-relaxation